MTTNEEKQAWSEALAVAARADEDEASGPQKLTHQTAFDDSTRSAHSRTHTSATRS